MLPNYLVLQEPVKKIEQLRLDLLELYVLSEKWQMKFNIEKCNVMHIGVNNTEADYEIAGHRLE